MNDVVLKGKIHGIEYSHRMKNTEFYKAQIEVEREDKKTDYITIKFKKPYCEYQENQGIEIQGNLRSYSYTENDKNKVELYVFTYFDQPERKIKENNSCIIDGRICRINNIYTTKNGDKSLQFILANNLYEEYRNLKFNSYIPIVCWDNDLIEKVSKLNVNDQVEITGEIHSRSYNKKIGGEDASFTVQELIARDVKILQKSSNIQG